MSLNPSRCFRCERRICEQNFRRCEHSTPTREPTSRSHQLIGRDAEIADIVAALQGASAGDTDRRRRGRQDPAGPRGRGAAADEFPDGVWLFELAAVGDAAAVPDAVAAVLGITQQPGKSLTEVVAAALEGRSRLLVFDNCEHVLDAASRPDRVDRGRSATVKILATSREGLRRRRRAGLAGAVVGRRHGPARRRLFVERARQCAPRFRPDRIATRWWRSADGSTEFRWRSSWRRLGWRR